MRLASFARGDDAALGAVVGDRIISFEQLDSSLPRTMETFLEAGEPAMAAAHAALKGARGGMALADTHLLPPIRFPRKFLGIGFNYSSHIEEVRKKGIPIPDLRNQVWFNKQTSCIVGPYDPIHLPSVSEQLDYECELAVVIGRRCRHVLPEDAGKVIAGYMVTNDLSIRDWQLKAPTATLGKSFDTHGPIGPWLTTANEVPDPHNLWLRTLVDGKVVQDGNTHEMVNRIGEQIAYLTAVMTLEPGDILATGTPHGVAAGRTPPMWLKAGQVVRTEIEGLGHMENRVISEPLTQTTFIS